MHKQKQPQTVLSTKQVVKLSKYIHVRLHVVARLRSFMYVCICVSSTDKNIPLTDNL